MPATASLFSVSRKLAAISRGVGSPVPPFIGTGCSPLFEASRPTYATRTDGATQVSQVNQEARRLCTVAGTHVALAASQRSLPRAGSTVLAQRC